MSKGDPATAVDPAVAQPVPIELIQLLPVAGLKDLLPKLAEFWRARRNCDSATVVVQDANTAVLQTGKALRRQPPSFMETAQSAIDSAFQLEWSLPAPIHGWMALPTSSDIESVEADPAFVASAGLIIQALWMDRAVASPAARASLEQEKLESLAEFAAGAGHEINNPVATIVGRTQMLLQEEADEDRRLQLLTIGAQALRIRDMIGDLMLYGRPPRPNLAHQDLAEIVAAESPKLQEAAAARKVVLSIDAARPTPIHADSAQVCVVLHALVRNSIEALRAGGNVVVTVEPGVLDGKPVGILTVTDDGPGLTETDRRHLFDPYYSGRQAGRGIGFGLPKCWQIARSHGGDISVESRPGETIVRVRWPSK